MTTPSVTRAELVRAVAHTKEQHARLAQLLAGSGVEVARVEYELAQYDAREATEAARKKGRRG